MEGKEVRFGISASGLFAAVTTAFTTGAVNSAHDSYTPLAGITMIGQMMLQCVFGGKGVGSRLVRGALVQIRAEGMKVIPVCPFVKAWIADHPEYKDLVKT